MQTIQQEHSRDAAYWGENGNWLIACSQHRDSDCLSRSNFECFKTALESLPEVKNWEGEFSPVTIERSNHWAVGWIEYLIINPECKSAIELAEKLNSDLESYPVLNEAHFSEMEMNDANEVWKNCYSPKDRIEFIRTHSGFEFNSFSDLIGCVRGKYFSGHPSELIS